MRNLSESKVNPGTLFKVEIFKKLRFLQYSFCIFGKNRNFSYILIHLFALAFCFLDPKGKRTLRFTNSWEKRLHFFPLCHHSLRSKIDPQGYQKKIISFTGPLNHIFIFFSSGSPVFRLLRMFCIFCHCLSNSAFSSLGPALRVFRPSAILTPYWKAALKL